jgi:hypothetical protein
MEKKQGGRKSMSSGYMGKILRIDLTAKSVVEEWLKAEDLRKFEGIGDVVSRVAKLLTTSRKSDRVAPCHVKRA